MRHSMRFVFVSVGSVVDVEGVVEIVRRLEQVGQTGDGSESVLVGYRRNGSDSEVLTEQWHLDSVFESFCMVGDVVIRIVANRNNCSSLDQKL